MPQIPVNSIVGFVGVLSLIVGFFLALAGSQIIRVEKVSVEPGPRTWGFGLGLLLVGAALLIADASGLPSPPTLTAEEPPSDMTYSASSTPPSVIDVESSPASAEATPVSTQSPALTPIASPIEVGTGVDVGQVYQDLMFGIRVRTGYAVEQIIRPAIIGPTDVAVGPDDTLYISEWLTHRVVQLLHDGSVVPIIEGPEVGLSLASDSEGNLYLPKGDDVLKITPEGDQTVVASGLQACGLALGSDNSLFTISRNSLIKISASGKQMVVSKEIPGCGDLAVGPSGDVFIAYWPDGELLRVAADGTLSTLSSGFAHNAFNVGVSPAGELYANQGYFWKISLQDGSRSEPLLDDLNVAINWRPFDFYPDGDAAFINPSTNTAVRVSLDGSKAECLLEGLGNSYGLAINANGELFLGESNCHPILTGRIVRLGPGAATQEYATGFGFIHDITFDGAGDMFIADFDYGEGGGGRLLKVNTRGEVEILPTGGIDLLSIVNLPNTGEIIGFDTNGKSFVSVSSQYVVQPFNVQFGAPVHTVHLGLDPQGDLIALVVFEEGTREGPIHRGVFRISQTGEPTLLATIDTPFAGTEDNIYVAPSGEIFIAGASEVEAASWILKLSGEGERSILAENLPFSTQSLVVDERADVYFTCAAGLFKIGPD
jgi:hypothetical protein